MGELKKTPLYGEHVKLGAKIIDFGGWEMPVYYSNVIEEHLTVRFKAGLFDICHMGELFIEGKDAFKLIQKLITNNLNKLSDGNAFYSCMCLENGHVIDDLFVYRFNETKFMIVVNASNIEKDLTWILDHKVELDVEVIDKSDKIAKLDLQGPRAEQILQKLTEINLSDIKRFNFVEGEVFDIPTIISRTGYTGEIGFELYFDSDKAIDVWSKLLEVGGEFGLIPIGLGARDTLRIEACYSLYGHELNEDLNPFEAGVGFVVKLDKKDFIGKEALKLVKEEGVKRKIFAFEMVDRGIAREHYSVFKNNVEIGYVTSGTFSPTFKKSLGMAMLDINEGFEQNEIHIKIRGKLHMAKIVKKPIYVFNNPEV